MVLVSSIFFSGLLYLSGSFSFPGVSMGLEGKLGEFILGKSVLIYLGLNFVIPSILTSLPLTLSVTGVFRILTTLIFSRGAILMSRLSNTFWEELPIFSSISSFYFTLSRPYSMTVGELFRWKMSVLLTVKLTSFWSLKAEIPNFTLVLKLVVWTILLDDFLAALWGV